MYLKINSIYTIIKRPISIFYFLFIKFFIIMIKSSIHIRIYFYCNFLVSRSIVRFSKEPFFKHINSIFNLITLYNI